MSAIAPEPGLRDVAGKDRCAVYFPRERAERTHECAHVSPIDFIAAKEVDGNVEHDEAGTNVEGGLADLVIELRECWLAGPVKHDKLVLVVGPRKHEHVAGLGAGLAVGGVDRRLL